MAGQYSIVRVYRILFIHSSADELLGCFHFLTVVNNAAMKTGVSTLLLRVEENLSCCTPDEVRERCLAPLTSTLGKGKKRISCPSEALQKSGRSKGCQNRACAWPLKAQGPVEGEAGLTTLH